MSTSSRVVPVKLQAGKEYVLRNGRHVTVIDNPHWQCDAQFPFAAIQGPDFVVYYKENGDTGSKAVHHDHDIIRPVYEVGEVYLSRDEGRGLVTLTVDDNDEYYPFEDDAGYSWKRDGRMFGTEEHPGDLMDYAPAAVPKAAPPATPDPWIGKRVRFSQEGMSGTGVVCSKHPEHELWGYAVRADKSDWRYHSCNGELPIDRGWWVQTDNMTLLDDEIVKEADVVSVDEVAAPADPVLPDIPLDENAKNIGKRVRYGVWGVGVIKGYREGFYAIEFDECSVGWDCDGLCEPMRGWFVSVLEEELTFESSEPEAQPEAELRSAPFTHEDTVAVWEAYLNAIRYNRSEYTIERIIADRKVLRGAT